MSELKVDDCSATFSLKKHYDAPTRLSYVTGTATHPKHGEIARLSGLALTSRVAWKRAGDFTEIMDEESDEMMRFSTEVFDSDMNLLPWLSDGGRRSGTGCWGAELNTGDIIYIQEIAVNSRFRGHGIGTWFLQQFLKSPQVTSNMLFSGRTHVFCWPSVGVGEQGTNDQVVSFFHKIGFRRIGRTAFFCYSSDPNHPSHRITVENDATRLENEFGNPTTLTSSELEAQFPLHVAVANVKTPEIAVIIRTTHATDPSAIHKKSMDGLTPIHIAAAGHNSHALRTLLELGVSADLQDATNNSGTTPLEALDESMRSTRLFLETMGIPWNGYSTEELTCQYLLKKAQNVPGLPSSEAEYISLCKLGCTCGQCIDGWLSGRMRFLLSVSAMFDYDTGMMELDCLHGRHSKEEYLDLISMGHLPPALHYLVNKRFCQSWFQTFRAVRDVLDSKMIPCHARVAPQPDSQAYVMQGGRVEYVLDAITSYAKDQIDDGDFVVTFSDDLENIPICANDTRFGLVRQKLGLDPQQRWGPYYDMDMDDMDEDDDDDDD